MLGMVFTTFLSTYFVFVSKNIYNALYLFIFLLPFSPRYIGFGIGQGGSSLSFKRIMLLILLMATSIFLMQHGRYLLKFVKAYKVNKLVVWMLVSVMIIQLASIVTNGPSIQSFVMYINDFLMTFFMVFIGTLLIQSIKDISKLYKAIAWSYILVIVLVLFESIVHHPIYTIFATDQIQASRDISESFIRDGMYRVSASFTNSIVLGAFLVSMFPFLLSYLSKKFLFFIVPIYMFCVYVTGSRAAVMLTFILLYLYLYFVIKRRSKVLSRLLYFLNIVLTVLTVVFLYYYISNIFYNFTNYMALETESERSTVSRALQFYVIIDYIKDAWWLGYGRIVQFQEFKDSFGASLDNYYIRIIAENGFLGLFAYSILIGTIVKYSFSIVKIDNKFIPIALSVVILVLYQFFLAIPYMWIYLYIFLGVMINIKTKYKKGMKLESTYDK